MTHFWRALAHPAEEITVVSSFFQLETAMRVLGSAFITKILHFRVLIGSGVPQNKGSCDLCSVLLPVVMNRKEGVEHLV